MSPLCQGKNGGEKKERREGDVIVVGMYIGIDGTNARISSRENEKNRLQMDDNVTSMRAELRFDRGRKHKK